MSPQVNNMETMLVALGKAQRDGVFPPAAARYPWQAESREVTSLGRGPMRWVKVAIPLAAAAAIAVLFVGPSLFESTAVNEIAQSIPATVMPSEPEALAEAQPVATTSAQTFDCDYNGDGQIDGRDIQAFVDRLETSGGDMQLRKEYLRHCLLGG